MTVMIYRFLPTVWFWVSSSHFVFGVHCIPAGCPILSALFAERVDTNNLPSPINHPCCSKTHRRNPSNLVIPNQWQVARSSWYPGLCPIHRSLIAMSGSSCYIAGTPIIETCREPMLRYRLVQPAPPLASYRYPRSP